MKSKKIWIGVGAFVMASTGSVALPKARADARVLDRPAVASGHESGRPASRFADGRRLAANTKKEAGEGGERAQGGEGGEGGQGGEAGINVGRADRDPVEYNIALQVIAAHYHAGLAAYEGKQTEAGAQMLAHGLSEVYVEMEDIFRRRGVTTLGKKLEAALEAATSNAPAAQVRKRVQEVLKALEEAEGAGPTGSARPIAVKARVVADMLDRAASQYVVALKDAANLEPYLDGLGFAMAAQAEGAKILPRLRRDDKKKADTLTAALKLAGEAYPGIGRPSKPKVVPGKFLAAASSARLAVSNWK